MAWGPDFDMYIYSSSSEKVSNILQHRSRGLYLHRPKITALVQQKQNSFATFRPTGYNGSVGCPPFGVGRSIIRSRNCSLAAAW